MPKHADGFIPGQGYTQEDWDEVCDNPEWTEEDFARARPAREVLPPEFFTALEEQRRARGRPPAQSPKQLVSLRLDRDVLEHFRAGGPGWQTRINAALRKATGIG